MGVDYIVTVGPVVVIKNPPVNTTETHQCCCNSECKQYHRTSYKKFCEECGHQIAEWVEPVVKPLHVDFYEVLKEKLVPNNHEEQRGENVILVANTWNDKEEVKAKDFGFYRHNLKYDGGFEIFPKPEDIAVFVKKFEEVFQNELTILKGIFGESNVNVRYGTLGTLSC